MAIDILQSQTRAIRVAPEGTTSWSDPSCDCLDSSGTVLASPTATADTVSTTLASTTNAWTVTLTSATGVAVGRRYKLTHDGVAYIVRVLELAGAVVTYDPALPEEPSAGDAWVGHEAAVTIPATATGTRSTWNCCRVYEDDIEARVYYHVVRQRWLTGFTSQDARSYIAQNWPSTEWSGVEVDQLVADAAQDVRAELLERGVYAEVYLDPDSLRPLMRAVLARDLATTYALVLPGEEDVAAYVGRLQHEIERRIGQLVRSYQPRDADDDGAVDADTPGVFAVALSL